MQYNTSNKDSIEHYARLLVDKNLSTVLGLDFTHRFNNKDSKGRLGQVVEEEYFGYKVNSRKEADFKEAGIELKVAPLKEIKPKENSDSLREKQGISAKERVVLSIINFMEIHKEQWSSNSLFDKCGQLLLMFYLNEKDKPIEELIFKIINVWSPSEEDFLVIKKDWEIIINKINDGKAHEISEGDTMYLGACTKGSTAAKSKRSQPFSEILAPQRAFSLKRSYVDSIIEELLQREVYFTKEKVKAISATFKDISFDEVILNLFKDLKGSSLAKIISKYDIIRERKAKNFNRLIVDDICKKTFGDKLDNLEEFKKANIEVKTILLKPSGMPKESMSFEQIDYCDITTETWEESSIRDKFENKKHLWIIFKATKNFDKQSELSLDEMLVDNIMFWNMPIVDLEGSMHYVWENTVDKILGGEYNSFIKISDKKIAHIRPKGKDSNDVMLTPQGSYERKKCFWLNASYIKEQIEKEG
ncbi:DNA mismatch repair protein MutH [Clostridium tagluense]|uniref:Sau3AI family type II restriction endonuclease n=1 Tax=Clostridium tagluense TaxID=360422 RepID=UPI001CF4D44A|nr:Sau3AI family type II restriction endonuclease [Clostridium tagluense]MCB2313456.1 DNA mismatch repair protein MutH [Clostridium tagluense]MCB2318277.1 DNA mismatch repair protein MutH [Clostridium tagluense]MCB2323079.1 DNA mismatch repair protein MutH [Clostridium tagluense]MCB2328061.1 DNA mismatch repair protein MutH [Clostridium tagluense]MCB2332783.1 DNA mismatch repair protein MutH [Clostridium tagluense]